jgi:broad specificity phosphatase PhoE
MNIAHPLYFLRHGATDWNGQGRYQGRTNTDLSSQGLSDARRNSELLRQLIDETRADHANLSLVSSPLNRARQTADIVAREFDLQDQVACNPAFQELSMGRWEGLTSQQVKQRYYEERKSRKLDRWHFKPVGGESMAERSRGIRQALSELSPGTIVVTHSVVLRIIICILTDLSEQVAAEKVTPHVSIWCWNGVKLHRQAQN